MKNADIARSITRTGDIQLSCVRKTDQTAEYPSGGCKKLAGICRELELPGKSLTWDTDGDGDWAEHVKGVDDYLVSLERNK